MPDSDQTQSSQALTGDCLAYLGLTDNPFSEHASAAFLYTDTALEMPVKVVLDYLANRNATLVLRGEAGIGKTTQLRLLLQRGYAQYAFCRIRAKTGLDLDAINGLIHTQWPTLAASPASRRSAMLENQLTRFIEAGNRPVLVIDDAHRLAETTLDALLRLKHAVGLRAAKALGLVLAAEPGIDIALTALETSNPAATQVHSIKLQPLRAEQTAAYITHRLARAGFELDAVLDSPAIAAIHRHSHGLPRYINALANKRLNELCARALSADRGETIDFRRIGLAILLAILGIAGLIALISYLAG